AAAPDAHGWFAISFTMPRAAGSFDVKLDPLLFGAGVDDPLFGRRSIDKRYHGDLDATGVGQMLSAGTPVQGSAGYVAIERVSGRLHGRTGTFALQHSGTMTRGAPELSVTVVPDSGTGQLSDLASSVRYLLKQKLLSWGDDYYVRDDQNRDVYFVDGKAFSIGDQLSFQDLSGRELAFIKQKIFALGRTYEISRNGAIAAVVQKHLFSPFHHRFTVDVPGPDDLEAEGNFTDHEYRFT